MSKPSTPKILMPAVWVAAIAIASVAMLVGSSHLRSASTTAAKPAARAQAPASAAQHSGIRANFDALPLAFEANQGQTDPHVKYFARGSGYTAFLTEDETRFALTSAHPSRQSVSMHSRNATNESATSAAIDMRLLGANSKPTIVAENQLPGTINYYTGNDRRNWQLGVKQYSAVSYRGVYAGVDVLFHAQQRQMEFDFIVSPGTDPAVIGMGFRGAGKIATDATGNLVLSSAAGDVVLHKPVAYQEKDGKREPVDAAFQLESKNEVKVRIGAYDRDRELVIDPSLSYATYLGGANEDEAFGIALDGSGNTYITGQTNSISFNGKAAGPTFNVFVTKLNSTGTAFAYTDIIAASGAGTRCSSSGSGNCSGNAIAVDGSGNAYVAGSATGGFPTLSGFQTTYGGGTSDGFVLKVNSSGTLLYSTYLGGSDKDIANGIAVDSSGNAYVAGDTFSTNFPTASPIQGSNKGSDDAFIAKLNASGSSLEYSTYIGGSSGDLATGIALDGSNNAYVSMVALSTDITTSAGAYQATAPGAGDGFVVQVMANGTEGYATYLGGSGTDNLFAIAVDSAGEACVTGNTTSSDYPTVNAAQSTLKGASDVSITKLNAAGSGLVFSTYLGGTLDESGAGVGLDTFGDPYVIGSTTSSDFPTGGQAFQTALSGTSDAFVAELSNTGFVVYSSYLGGTGTENSLPGGGSSSTIGAIAVDSTSNAYLAGDTSSTTGFPTTPSGAAQANYGGGLADAFVAKVGPAPPDFSVAVSPTTTSASSGAASSPVTVTVSSVSASFGQAVTLSCGNLPAKATCNFGTTSVTPTTTVGTSTLTINTNGSASASMLMPNSSHPLDALAFLLMPILGIAVVGGGIRGRRRKILGLLLLGMVLIALLMLPACGGSSSTGGGGGTPPGSYNLTVSGAAGGVTHSIPLTLTVN